MHTRARDNRGWKTVDASKTVTRKNFRRKTPFAAGIVALRLSIRNDQWRKRVKLNLHRIRLLVQLDQDNKQGVGGSDGG